jgi:hypothetical protein
MLLCSLGIIWHGPGHAAIDVCSKASVLFCLSLKRASLRSVVPQREREMPDPEEDQHMDNHSKNL